MSYHQYFLNTLLSGLILPFMVMTPVKAAINLQSVGTSCDLKAEFREYYDEFTEDRRANRLQDLTSSRNLHDGISAEEVDRLRVPIVSYLSQLGEFEQAQAIAQPIANTNEKALAIVYIINGMATYEAFDQAFVLLETLEQERYQQMAQAAIAEGFSKVGRVDEALTVIEAFDHGHPGKIAVLRASIISLIMDGQLDQALDLVDQLEALEAVEPIWMVIANHIIESGALVHLRDADHRDRLPPQLVRALAIAQAAPETMDEALFWVAQLDEEPWTLANTLEEMHRLLSINGHFEQALDLLDRMEQPYLVEQHTLVRCMVAYGELDRAIAFTEEIQGNQPDEVLFQMLAVELVQQQGDIDRAIALYETSNQVWGWPAIAAAIATSGHLNRATQILEWQFDNLMIEVDAISSELGRTFTIESLLSHLVLAQGFEQAFQLVDRMQPSDQVIGIRDILAGLAIAGEFPRMMDVFASYEHQIESPQQELTIAVSSLAQSQYFDEAIALLDHIDDSNLRLKAVSMLAREMAKVGGGDRAVTLLQNFSPNHLDVDVAKQSPQTLFIFQDIIYDLVEQDKIDQALQIVEAADDPFHHALLKLSVVFKTMAAQDFDTARPILDQVLHDIGLSHQELSYVSQVRD